MSTGDHIKLKRFGTDAIGFTLKGDPMKPEPTYGMIHFPGGMVEVARCTDGTYWAHISVNREDAAVGSDGRVKRGQVIDGRQDTTDKHAGESHPGELNSPNLYHLAVRIGTKKTEEES